MKWMSKDKRKKYSLKRFFNSFKYAGSGIISAFKTEQNLTAHTIFTIVVLLMSYFFKISVLELCLILFAIGLVISLELINTAIEYTIDMSMPNINPLAKLGKDIASGAVLFSAIIALIIGIIIFIPKIIAIL